MESWLRRRVLQEFNETKQKTVLLTSLKAGGVGLDLTAASNVVFKLALEHLEKETLKWCREITWNSSTAICVLNAGLHSVMGMADFKYVISTYWGLEAMPHSYSMLRCLAAFPWVAVPVTAEEEPPPDLSCCGSNGAAKNLSVCVSVSAAETGTS
ncbi:hypothetical protein DY000_02045616 [Brassica cretica]|uniref:Uncharacterized protein n=1 Tax=Brassica cretica TaxID=69181 RepID=A0ABQ7F124_BRACR|nr:hypothetical protein DY000_02045616 [Brassica cretica]